MKIYYVLSLALGIGASLVLEDREMIGFVLALGSIFVWEKGKELRADARAEAAKVEAAEMREKARAERQAAPRVSFPAKRRPPTL